VTALGSTLDLGLKAPRYLLAGLAADRSSSERDCRRDNVLPVTCLLTSGEAAFLQERLGLGTSCRCAAWRLLAGLRAPSALHAPLPPPRAQGWAHVWIVVDMTDDDPRWATTLQARPLCEGAFSTPLLLIAPFLMQVLSPFALAGYLTVVRGRKRPARGPESPFERVLQSCGRVCAGGVGAIARALCSLLSA